MVSPNLSGGPRPAPQVHHATWPLRAAAPKGDADEFNLWAGQAHDLVSSGPAAEILRSISEDARKALETAANPVL